jgi:uroporphyrin-III C-methyltransferase
LDRTLGRFDLPKFQAGWVWLVGAGPGDPGLLTLHAVNALEQADAIVYDALVSEEILKLAPLGAIVEYAGKRGGKPSPNQRDISARLVQLARRGHRVLRLKGGDPFVFGRGAEEALALVEACIPFRIVPGVTSGIGGLGYAGIPVTHRETNHAVTFVTGHMAGGAMPDNVNWAAIAQGSPVIVLYMGLKHLGEIADQLIKGGRNPGEAVAVVSKASTAEQRVLETTLANAALDAAAAKLPAPALIVIGDVVRLRSGLDWLGAIQDGRKLDADPLGELLGQKRA